MVNVSRRNFIEGLSALSFLAGCAGYRELAGAKLKFGLLSDIHYKGEKDDARIRKALTYYRDAGVDAVAICGDLADSGLVAQLEALGRIWYEVFPDDKLPDGRKVEKLFVTGNHDWEGQNYGDHARKLYPDRSLFEKNVLRFDLARHWQRIFREPYASVWKKEVRGYSFVGVNWEKGERGKGADEDFNDGIPGFYAEHGRELDPSKPFFHLQHPHPRGTCYGPWAWGRDWGQTEVLKRYSNAVALSGHSHYPLTDVRSVWQGEYTSVGCGSLDYVSFPSEEFRGGYDNVGWEEGRMTPGIPQAYAASSWAGMLVSVYGSTMVLERRDFAHDAALGEDWVVPLAPRRNGPFDGSVRALEDGAPAFLEGARVTVAEGPRKNRAGVEKPAFAVSFPAAMANPAARAFRYDVEAQASDGTMLKVKRVLDPDGFLPPALQKDGALCVFAAEELPSRPTRFVVRPVSAVGAVGAPLTAELDQG